MAVELDGNVRMRGDTGPGVGVKVLAGEGRLRLLSGEEVVGDWLVEGIGISSLQEGFNIKAEGEEFILRTNDDVALAEELHVTAVSPRLARRLAARHNPEYDEPSPEPPQISSNLAAIGYAVAGALVVLGGSLLSGAGGLATAPEGSDFDFWIAFVAGGILMIAAAYVMSVGTRLARLIATSVLGAVIVTFGFAVNQTVAGTTQLTAYGFIAGGLVLGVAVLVSGSLRQSE
ncbi:MAG: hypothetical protein ACLFWH_07595 [Actinomycetota bacterium]